MDGSPAPGARDLVAGVNGRRTATSPDGTPIAYWQGGTGRPVLLVGGGTSDHTRWAPLLPMLEPHATICTVDRRGRGDSGDAPGYAIQREYEDIAAVVDAVAGEHGVAVDLLGHSFGGLCALEAALITSNIGRLVIYEAPLGVDQFVDMPRLMAPIERLIAQGRPDEALEIFLREGVRSPEAEIELLRNTPMWERRVANVHTMVREAHAIGEYHFDPERFRPITVPTLFIVGGAHPSNPGAEAALAELLAVLHDARVERLEGQQHMAMDTAPELFVDTLLRFLGCRSGV